MCANLMISAIFVKEKTKPVIEKLANIINDKSLDKNTEKEVLNDIQDEIIPQIKMDENMNQNMNSMKLELLEAMNNLTLNFNKEMMKQKKEFGKSS